MTYQEAIDYLDSFINYEKTLPKNYRRAFKLERTRRLLSLLGDPHKYLKTIHITGTKGKGSTAAMAASILKEAGFRVGLYTSPHLVSFRERIRVDNEMIGEDALCRIVADIKSHLETLRRDDLSFFEVYTAIAFLYFKERDVDFAVIEVGLGGRLDATNVVDSKIAVITPISLEHTRILGSTIREIAHEKAGIIKEGAVCISGPQERDALDVIEQTCAKKDAALFLVGRDIYIDNEEHNQDMQYFNLWTRFAEYPLFELRLRGQHQIINAACAIAAVEAMRLKYNVFVTQDAIREGIRKAEWPGRLEVIDREPLVIVDGAQNTASASVLIDGIRRHFNFRNLILILGISKDKDIEGICKVLTEVADTIILTRADNPRAADPQVLKNFIKDKPVKLFLDSADALSAAHAEADKSDLILVTGSLFLVGEIRETMENVKCKAKNVKLKVS